ncbi:MAG: GNAT family N-acetyltransferase [Yoonia sp.]|uniref:GNAT family N-acetyltransferase n=1 Tax=Yoonia sp. TaxID=2212373 RepID=UPI003EF7652D
MSHAPAVPLQQHPLFANALKHLGRDVVITPLDHAAPLVAVRVMGQKLASRGPVWERAVPDCDRRAALSGCGVRLLNPDAPDHTTLRPAGFRQIATAASVAELDLRGSHADRQTAMQGKWRNRWRSANKAPVTFRQDGFDLYRHRWLLDADKAQQKQKRFRGMPHQVVTAIAETQPAALRLHLAMHADQPVAATLFILHRPVVTYHIGWLSPAARQWSLHHAMLTDAAKLFADTGYHRLDLGLVDTETAPGLARFKIGSGAAVRQLGGTWLRLGRCH